MRVFVPLAIAGLFLAAAIDLRVLLRGPGPQITEGAMLAARKQIDAERKPGDVLVHSPLLPGEALRHLGDLAISPHLPSDGVRRSRRVLILDRADQPMFGFDPPARELLVADGALVVRIVEPTVRGDTPVSTLLETLSARTMTIERPPGQLRTRCDRVREQGGFWCPAEAEWLYAAPHTARVDGQDTQCLWAHPTTGGVIVLELPGPPAIAGRALRVDVAGAINDDAVRTTQGGATVSVDVVQERSLGKLETPNRMGWHRASFPVVPDKTISLRITTPSDGRRHFCINAEVVAYEVKP